MTKQKQLTIMKSTLAVLLAGSVTFSGTSVFANSDGKTFDSVKMEEQEASVNTNVQVNDEATIDSVKNEIDKLEESTAAPSIVPGDFFYFAKLALEKVKLAFTLDESKEAKLIAVYAAERLAEAEALFQAGQEEKSVEAIQKAIEMMNSFEDKMAEEAVKEDAADQPADDADPAETDANHDSDTDADISKEETADGTTSDEKAIKEIKEMMSENIAALSSALERVKNPKAKAALQKNIDKSYAKLAEKLAKHKEKLVQQEEEKDETKESGEEAAESVTEVTADSSSDEGNTTIPAVDKPAEGAEETETATETVPVKNQLNKQEVKEERKAVQQQAKEQREEKKQEAREKHDKKKEEREQAHQKERKEHRSQKENHDSKGNGHKESSGQKGNGHNGNGRN
ncbi:hypothetical protein HP456_06050 [Bacillus haikouensis]|uniref:DUF5667 domain-containing protein n=1 Tax=Bacillus haikouensis TaxID=1510468 RepID=UPI00155821FB|nr:DUF5667 domain-containing protein [Bacillus haikouensis]NQD65481.1 hypothetical protein [Bacillus haikouensis]